MAATDRAWLQTCQHINTLLKTCGRSKDVEWQNIVTKLKTTTELLKDVSNREKASGFFFADIFLLLKFGHSAIAEEGGDRSSVIETLTECYRCLRNACVNSPGNQALIYKHKEALETTHSILQLLKEDVRNTYVAVLLRCAIQFLGNFVVGNEQHQECVWRMFSSLFSHFLSCADQKLPQYTSMVLHTCLSSPSNSEVKLGEFITKTEDGTAIVKAVLEAFQLAASEWMLYLMEDFLKIDNFWGKLSNSLNTTQKLLLMEVVSKLISDAEDPSHQQNSIRAISESNVLSLAKEFTESSHAVLSLCSTDVVQSNVQPDSQELSDLVVKELDVLCMLTSDPHLHSELRQDCDLLRTALELLHSIHSLGKMGDNVFTSVNRLADSSPLNRDHLAFGLKRDLIRLISNLVYKNPVNQNLVRELDGIPLILDQTCIDERNPFITQWAVFAIRNLCEDNMDNKAVLANLKLSGLADSVSMLKDFGVEAELRDDKIVVKPSSNS